MVPEDVYQAYVDHSAKLGSFSHGFTYGGHPLSCALGVKAIEIYQKRDIVGHVRELIPGFERRMARIGEHPLVGEARSCGLMGGVELVADKRTKRAFDPKKGVGPRNLAADRGERRHPAGARRHHRHLPADDHFAGRTRRAVRPAGKEPRPGRGLGGGATPARYLDLFWNGWRASALLPEQGAWP